MVNNYSYYDNLSAKDVFDLAQNGDKQALEYIGSLLAYSSNPQKCIELAAYFWDLVAANVDNPGIASVFCRERNMIEYTEAGAKYGNTSCIYGVACVYSQGHYGVEIDEEKGFVYLKTAADKGHGTASLMAGLSYFLGKGIAVDYERAIYYLEKAIAVGKEEAAQYLAASYYEKQDERALKYAEISKLRGELAGYYYVGMTYYYLKNDIEKALIAFIEALKQFPEDSMELRYRICLCCIDGYYGNDDFRSKYPDVDEVVHNLIDEMLDVKDYYAYIIMGILYQDGKFGYQKDENKGLECFKTARENGIDNADGYIEYLTERINADKSVAENNPAGAHSLNSTPISSNNSGKTEYEIIYEEKKKKRLLTAAVICVVVSLLLRAFLVYCSRLYLPAYFLFGEEMPFSVKIIVPLKTSVFQFSYFNAIILLSVMLIRRGKKAAVIGIFAAIGLLLCDLLILEPLCLRHHPYWVYYGNPKITFGFPEGYYRQHGYWAEYLTFTVLSAVVSLVIYFITMSNIKTQTVWWYLIAVYWSIALLGVALIVAVVIFGVLVTVLSGSSPSYSTASSSYGDSSGGWFDNSSEEPRESESIEKQARYIADVPGKYALFKQGFGWVVMDHYERLTQVHEVATGDLYNTYFATSSGERYYVPTSSVSDDRIYEVYKSE